MRSLMQLLKDKDPVLSRSIVSLFHLSQSGLMVSFLCLGEKRSGTSIFWISLDHIASLPGVFITR